MSGQSPQTVGPFRAVKHHQLHERQAAIRLQLETTDRDGKEMAKLAIKAFELSQSLKARWLTADYRAKRTILQIMCESVLSNFEKLDISLRKPFDLLRDEKFVPLSGASGTPIELFLAAIREIEPETQIGLAGLMAPRFGAVSSPA